MKALDNFIRIGLVRPWVDRSGSWGSVKPQGEVVVPLGILMIKAYLDSLGHKVTVIDGMLYRNRVAFMDAVFGGRFNIVGIQVFTNSAAVSFECAAAIKKIRRDCVIVLGGVHPSSLPERTLEECREADFVVIGEGEETFEDLIEVIKTKQWEKAKKIKGIGFRHSGEIVITKRRRHIENLGKLPSFVRTDVSLSHYTPTINYYRKKPCFSYITSRGCPFSCSFCQVHVVLGKQARWVPAKRVIEDLIYLKEQYNAKSILFVDSTFTLNRQYTMQLLNGMIDAELGLEWSCITRTDCIDEGLLMKMKEAGCWQVSFGIETANQKSLNIINKGGKISPEYNMKMVRLVKRMGLSVQATFILCLPGEDEQMVLRTIKYAIDMCPDIALFFLPTPYPGSELFKTCKETGEIREDYKWEDFLSIDYDNPVYINPLLGKEKMVQLYRKAYRRFYTHPKVFRRAALMIHSKDDVFRYLRAAYIAKDLIFSKAALYLKR